MHIKDLSIEQIHSGENMLERTMEHHVKLDLCVVQTLMELQSKRNIDIDTRKELYNIIDDIKDIGALRKCMKDTEEVNNKLSEEVVDLQVFKEKIKDLVHWFDADLSNIEGKVDHYISGNDQEYIDDLMDAIKDGIDRLKQRVNGIREQ